MYYAEQAAADLIGNNQLAQARVAQQHAMNQHLSGQERSLRVQVLSLAVAAQPNNAVTIAEEFWAFITAGDPVDAEGANKL